MPYINEHEKTAINPALEEVNKIIQEDGITSGQLNYVFTKICLMYLQYHGKRYSYCNDIIGALEACKQEFYRRIVAPYEEEKKLINGDVFNE